MQVAKKRLSSPTLNELRPLLPAYVTLFLFSCFMPIAYLAAPIYAYQVMARVSVSRSEATLFVLATIATFLLAIAMVLESIRKKALDRLGVAIDQRFSRFLFEVLHRPRTAARAAASPTSLQDFNNVRNFLSGSSVTAIFDAAWAPIFIVVLFCIHWIFGVIAVLLLGKTTALTFLNHWLVWNDSKRFEMLSLKANEFGQAVSRNVDSVRALGMLPPLRDRWYGLHSKMLGWQSAATRRTNLIAHIIKFLRLMQTVIFYTVGAILFINNEISMGAIIVSMMIMNRGLGPVDQVISNWRNYSAFFVSLGRLDDLLRDAGAKPKNLSLSTLAGPLVVSRVFVPAPGTEKLILNDVSFTLPQGRVLGVVGPSGAGKSCLARVLVGIWPPVRGSVTVGDHDLSHWNDDELGRHIGYMAQDIELLPGTVADNIARFNPAFLEDTSKLISAAELAGIQDLIKALPDGYNTLVGVGGHVLSGGQRQRIALARAVVGNPSLVVLDEPNSNLDAVSEQALMTLIQKLQSMQTTVVIITHKLNILSYCDDVLVLNAGSVQAFGTRDQVVSRIAKMRTSPALTVVEGSAEGRRS